MAIGEILILLASAIASSYGMLSMDTMTEEKATAAFDCIAIIECVVKEGYQMKRLYDKVGPEGKEVLMKEFGDILNFAPELFEDIDQFFADYSEHMCQYTKEQRKNGFQQFMIRFGAWYEDACKRIDPTECKKGEEAMEEGYKLIEEYTAAGKCNRPDEEAKEMGNDEMTKMKGFGG